MVESEKGDGSSSSHIQSMRRPAASRAQRVLIIDDQEDAAVGLASYLSTQGYTVAAARTGEAGLAAARELRPHAAIVNIGASGMDGFEVAQALRTTPETAGALLIAVSGYSLKTFRAAEAYSIFRHYLLKPTNPETIAAILARALAPSEAST